MAGRSSERNRRADAQRNIETLVRTARDVFASSGVEAPMREIAEKAGVGVGTIYRNFPQRSNLIAAVFRSEVDVCADAAASLAKAFPAGEALDRWMQRYVDFIVAKRGLAAALHSGDPAFEALPAYFDSRFEPALQSLLDAAVTAGEIRPDANPYDLLRAVASLFACRQATEIRHRPAGWSRCLLTGCATARPAGKVWIPIPRHRPDGDCAPGPVCNAEEIASDFTNESCLQNSGSKFPQIDLETRMLDGFSNVRSDRGGIGR